MSSQIQAWTIRRNTERYPDPLYPHKGHVWPDIIVVWGTIEQAQEVSGALSNLEAGCDYYFYIVGVDDE